MGPATSRNTVYRGMFLDCQRKDGEFYHRSSQIKKQPCTPLSALSNTLQGNQIANVDDVRTLSSVGIVLNRKTARHGIDAVGAVRLTLVPFC